MTIARSQQIQLDETTWYHCIARCVRQAFLCGTDYTTGQSFDHRRMWIIERIRLLSSAFTIDVAAYAIMSNHYHLILHADQKLARAMSDQEVADRWCTVFKGSKSVERYLAGDETVAEMAKATLSLWRSRLYDISWFMRSLNEYIARRANVEDDCSGRFWEGRFKSQPLLDEKALMAAMVYVDLNPIRAQMCQSISHSEYTSAYERLHGRACIGDSYSSRKPLMRFALSRESGEKVRIPCTAQQYSNLLDWSCTRVVHSVNSTYRQSNLPSLLQQLQFTNEQWHVVCTQLGKLGLCAIGRPENVIHFHQVRGVKRTPRSSPLAQLFA